MSLNIDRVSQTPFQDLEVRTGAGDRNGGIAPKTRTGDRNALVAQTGTGDRNTLVAYVGTGDRNGLVPQTGSGSDPISNTDTTQLAAANQAASEVTVPDANQAAQLLSFTASSLPSSPAQALAAQANLSTSDVSALLAE